MSDIGSAVVGFLVGAYIFGQRRWAAWCMAAISLLSAFAKFVVGDWLWGFGLFIAFGFWLHDALTLEPAA